VDDRACGKRAVAKRSKHGIAACLDALGDLNFALARERLKDPHFVQKNAHEIVDGIDIRGIRRGNLLVVLGLLFLVQQHRLVLFSSRLDNASYPQLQVVT
jgi:hypothetical protein